MTFLTTGTSSVVPDRSRSRAVHHGEDARVDLLLDRQQIDERAVDPRVRVVPVIVEEPPNAFFIAPVVVV
jgi:hypothetical protein